jgi:dolichol kinase
LHPGSGYNRIARKLLHIAGSVFAFFVGVLPWWVFLVLALVGLAFAYWLKPSHGLLRAITKPIDRKRGMISGVRGYFWAATWLALLWFVLEVHFTLPNTERFIAFGWLALTLGDALAGIVGPRPAKFNTVYWNREKTWWGLFGCFIGALLGFVIAFSLPLREPAGLNIAALVGLGSLCAVLVALAESLDSPVDDNYTVGLGAPLIALAILGLAGVVN